ncbi:hypothetical protein [Ruminococcus sp.]|uniref:hypothetical protein n=1 Tax=Ruminococcus sp. TaxID=41978 RepID=UPI00344EF36C
MKKEIKVIPYTSVNGVKFGIKREELWKKVGDPIDIFKKDLNDKIETDGYNNSHVFYDDNYLFEAIELFDLDELDLYYNNKKLSDKYSEILDYFKTIFDDIEEDEAGFISKKGSVGVGALMWRSVSIIAIFGRSS